MWYVNKKTDVDVKNIPNIEWSSWFWTYSEIDDSDTIIIGPKSDPTIDDWFTIDIADYLAGIWFLSEKLWFGKSTDALSGLIPKPNDDHIDLNSNTSNKISDVSIIAGIVTISIGVILGIKNV